MCSFAHERCTQLNVRCCVVVERQSHLLSRPRQAFTGTEDPFVCTLYRYQAVCILQKSSYFVCVDDPEDYSNGARAISIYRYILIGMLQTDDHGKSCLRPLR